MTCLLASFLAACGGRWWVLSLAVAQRRARPTLWPVAASAVVASSLAAASGAWIGAQVRGPGMLLFLALALLFAGAGALWPIRPAERDAQTAAVGPVAALILLLSAQLSDSAAFVVLAVAAWSGDPVLATIGGAAGMMASALGGTMLDRAGVPRRRLRPWRLAVAATLLIVGTVLAVRALGLI